MGQLLHFNSGSLRNHKPPVPYSVLLSNNYVIIRPCSRNIMGSTIQCTAKKSTYKFSSHFPFKAFLCSLAKKIWQIAHSFINPPLIFAIQSLIISQQHMHSLVCLAKVFEHLVLPNVMKALLLINRYFAEGVSKILNSQQYKTLKQ